MLARRGKPLSSLLLIAVGSADSRFTAHKGNQGTIVNALKG
jgi:hypothetical protein